MPVLAYILLFCFIGSVGAILLISTLLFLPARPRTAVIDVLVLYAIGTLLGVTFLDLLPTALEQAPLKTVFATTLGGLVLFFMLEKAVIWHQCHQKGCDVGLTAGPLILIGDGLHNFFDGIIIAAVFLVSIPVGITTALAVLLHEIFHEAGDLAILLASGYTRRQAILFNLLSSLTTFAGALIAYVALEAVSSAQPYVLAVSAASFLYIALAQLIPALPRHVPPRQAVWQIGWLCAGIGTVTLLEVLLHR